MYYLQTSPKGLGDACSTCTLVVNFIKNFVDASSSEDEVKTALETLCKVLPGNISTDVMYSVMYSIIAPLAQYELRATCTCMYLYLC